MAIHEGIEASGEIARELDGARLVFRGYDGLWMIDRLAEPANERGDEDDAWGCDEAREAPDEAAVVGSTAISAHELVGMSSEERARYLARQLRKLGLPARGRGARVLWSMIRDFHGFAP